MSGFRHAATPRQRRKASEQRRTSVINAQPALHEAGHSLSVAGRQSCFCCLFHDEPTRCASFSNTTHATCHTMSIFGGAHTCAPRPNRDVCITPGPAASVTICGEQEGLALTVSCGQTVARKRSAFPHAKLRVNEEAARETVRCVCCPSCNRPCQMRGKSMSAVCAALDLGIEDRAVAHPSSMRVMMALSR